MPELPEVETVRRDLDRDLPGRTLEFVAATGRRSIRRHAGEDELRQRLLGRTVTSVDRRGKYLLLRCDGDSAVAVIHLGMSGQLLLGIPGDPPVLHTHVVLGFGAARELRFVDPRTFGEVFVSSDASLLPELAHLGVDPVDELKSAAHLATLLRARRARLKPLLLDQRFLAGLGNIYSDEILFTARLRYDRHSDTLGRREVERLYHAISATLLAAIAARGSSLADQQYRDALGAIGGYQLRHQVYGREGLPCRRCGRPVARVRIAGRSSFFCPRCQR